MAQRVTALCVMARREVAWCVTGTVLPIYNQHNNAYYHYLKLYNYVYNDIEGDNSGFFPGRGSLEPLSPSNICP